MKQDEHTHEGESLPEQLRSILEVGNIAANSDSLYLLSEGMSQTDGTYQGCHDRWWRECEFNADRIVAEANQGGEMVEATIRMIDASVPFSAVHATRSKIVRAEPIS